MTLLLIALIILAFVCLKSKIDKANEDIEYENKTRTNVELEKQIRAKWNRIITKELEVPIGNKTPWEFLQDVYKKYGVPWCHYLRDEHDQKKDFDDYLKEAKLLEEIHLSSLRTKECYISCLESYKVRKQHNLKDYYMHHWKDVFPEFKDATFDEILEIVRGLKYEIFLNSRGVYPFSPFLYDREKNIFIELMHSAYGEDGTFYRYEEGVNTLFKYQNKGIITTEVNYLCYIIACPTLRSKYNNLKSMLSRLELKKNGYAASPDGIHESHWQEFQKQQKRKEEYNKNYPDFKDL